jgi:hypothetical protein
MKVTDIRKITNQNFLQLEKKWVDLTNIDCINEQLQYNNNYLQETTIQRKF